MATDLSFSDYYANGLSPNMPFVEESHLVGATHLRVVSLTNNPAGHFPDPPMDDYVLQIVTKGAANAQIDLGVRGIRSFVRKGGFGLAPPDTPTDIQIDGVFDLLCMGLPRSLFKTAHAAVGTGQSLNLEQLHADLQRNPLIEQLMLGMFREARAGSPQGALFVDHAAHTLVAALLNLAGRLKTQGQSARPITDAMLAKVTNMIEDRIDEKITLDELAAVTDWDVYRFTRAFRNAVGQTPHQYVLSRRIERARSYLSATEDTLADVAFAVGFSSQQHMTNVFSKHLGVTPAKYRTEVRA